MVLKTGIVMGVKTLLFRRKLSSYNFLTGLGDTKLAGLTVSLSGGVMVSMGSVLLIFCLDHKAKKFLEVEEATVSF